MSPRGPNGPKESSRDSSLVACAPTRLIGVLGPLPDDTRTPELADAESGAVVDLDCDSVTVSKLDDFAKAEYGPDCSPPNAAASEALGKLAAGCDRVGTSMYDH